MSLYLDGSILVKLLAFEPESERVAKIIQSETKHIVSSLARLEALVVLGTLVAAGEISKRTAGQRKTRLQDLLALPSFAFERVRSEVFEIAEEQLAPAYCATLDRLHLAAMHSLGLRRLFTNDDQQTRAARALGYEVIMPR